MMLFSSINKKEHIRPRITFFVCVCLGIGIFLYIPSIYAQEDTTPTFEASYQNEVDSYASTTPNGGINFVGLVSDEDELIANPPQKKPISKTSSFKGLEKNENDVYTHHELEYSFKSPQDWKVREIPSMFYARIENVDLYDKKSESEKDRKYFKIEVVALSANNLTLDKWVQHQNSTSHPLPTVLEQQDVEISGEHAIYQLEKYGEHVSPVFYVLKKNVVYIINPSNNDQEFSSIISEFISNFTLGEK